MELSFLFADWLGKPAWLWLGFLGLVLALLAFDLGVLHRERREIGVRESLILSAFYIGLGLAFGGFVWWQLGAEAGMNYLAGFTVEKALAMDNVFVIAMIFAFFSVPRLYQHRVLFWGILGVIVLRALMIGFGAAVVAQFSWVLYLFAVFLTKIGASLDRYGFVNAILIDAESNVIAGEGRLLAAKERGFKQVPTVCLAHMSEADQRAYRISTRPMRG